jgi:4-amino-4-deoxy-L-arabinose transferase-like glycosyltransferase
MTGMADPRSLRRSAFVLGLAVFVSCAYFYQAGGWNQNTRFALVRALLEEHTVRIDTYRDHTGDRAVWKGHVYADKAPGVSFLALAPSAAARAAARLAGVDPASMRGVIWTSYVASVSTAALFTAIAALCVYWLTLRWGASRGAALFAATAYALSGPAWAYGTVFIGHNVTAGCLMLAFTSAVALADADPRHRSSLAWAVGLLCGLAVLTEFPAAVPVAIIVVFALRTIYLVDRDALVPLAARVVAGGAVMAVVLMAYHNAAFDSPFRLGYGSEDNVEGAAMQQGLFGISHPTPHIVYEVLLGAYRGLLPISPLVILTPGGLILTAQASTRRLAIVTAAGIAGFYVLLNVSYTYWEGGWFYGPRHLVPGLPFLALGLAILWDQWRGWFRAMLVGLWLLGTGISLVAVSTTVQPPSDITEPVSQLMWPAFREGDLALNPQSYVDYGADPDHLRHNPAPHASWNLGEVAGLHGLPSLLPLIAVWVVAALLL